jgi:hypothetical protein
LGAWHEEKDMKLVNDTEETVHPTARAILNDVVIQDDGLSFVDNYVNWVMALRKLPARENSRLFVQLAVLSRQYFDAGCKPVALSLASLARIGLGRLVKA